MNFLKRLLPIFCAVLLCSVALAHSGRTDSSGGHRDSSTGEYHYHHGYSAHQHTNGICPFDFDDQTGASSGSSASSSSVSAPAPEPVVVVETKTDYSGWYVVCVLIIIGISWISYLFRQLSEAKISSKAYEDRLSASIQENRRLTNSVRNLESQLQVVYVYNPNLRCIETIHRSQLKSHVEYISKVYKDADRYCRVYDPITGEVRRILASDAARWYKERSLYAKQLSLPSSTSARNLPEEQWQSILSDVDRHGRP